MRGEEAAQQRANAETGACESALKNPF